MFNTRPAAEIEPDRAISSSTATLPGPIFAPDARSTLILSRSIEPPVSAGFGFRFAMAGQKITFAAVGSIMSQVVIPRARTLVMPRNPFQQGKTIAYGET